MKQQHRTTILIDEDDWKYCEKQGIKPTHALRAFIRDHRASTNDPSAPMGTLELRRKLDAALKRLEEMRDFMNEKGVIDEYIKKIA